MQPYLDRQRNWKHVGSDACRALGSPGASVLYRQGRSARRQRVHVSDRGRGALWDLPLGAVVSLQRPAQQKLLPGLRNKSALVCSDPGQQSSASPGTKRCGGGGNLGINGRGTLEKMTLWAYLHIKVLK